VSGERLEEAVIEMEARAAPDVREPPCS
jgi:hypothetical protein